MENRSLKGRQKAGLRNETRRKEKSKHEKRDRTKGGRKNRKVRGKIL